MGRILLYTAPDRMMADMYVVRFMEAGIPVMTSLGTLSPGIMPTGGPTEIWLEDETLLADERVLEAIREIIPFEPDANEQEG
jgi:hypothetical protein